MSLGVTPGRHLALEADAQGLGAALHQRLRRQHMRQLARADAEGQRAHAAVRAGVAVAAHDQAAGQAQPQLRPHHVHDALAGLADVEQADAGLAWSRRAGPASSSTPTLEVPARPCALEMAWSGVAKVRCGLWTLMPRSLQIEQAARAAEVVQQVPVDVQQVGVVAEIGDHVRCPRSWRTACGPSWRASRPDVVGLADSREPAWRLVNAGERSVVGQLRYGPRSHRRTIPRSL